jgi:hypothetical protein
MLVKQFKFKRTNEKGGFQWIAESEANAPVSTGDSPPLARPWQTSRSSPPWCAGVNGRVRWNGCRRSTRTASRAECKRRGADIRIPIRENRHEDYGRRNFRPGHGTPVKFSGRIPRHSGVRTRRSPMGPSTGEKTTARWVRQVTARTIVQANGAPAPLLLNHYFRGLDDHRNAVADFEIQLFGATPGDDAFDFIVANLNHDVRHHIAELHVFDLTTKLIACG